MTASDRPTFALALRDTFAAYGKVPSDQQAESYWDGLEDVPISQVLTALRSAKRTSRFAPSVATIRSSVGGADVQRGDHAAGWAAYQAGEQHCPTCEDTGWVTTVRLSKFGDHRRYAVACACRACNPIYQAKRAYESRNHAREDA